LSRRASLALALAALAAGCGGGRDATTPTVRLPPVPQGQPIPRAADGSRVVVGALNFPEQRLLGELYAQALRAAGYRVRARLDFGSDAAALAALRRGRIDAYPEYVGVVTRGLGPHRPAAAFARARAALGRRGVIALPPTPFEDAPAFAMTRRGARGATTLSDLRPRAPRLVLAGPPGCRARLDCARGLARRYGLRFRRVLEVPSTERYRVLRSGRADVSAVSSTDGALAARDLVLLRDDRRLLAPYQVTLLLRRAPGTAFRDAVARLQPTLTTARMQQLNARLDRGDAPARVAAEHLRSAGLVP
jgi:glycine betaine/choline ABC-type transport system substrate-binding protein